MRTKRLIGLSILVAMLSLGNASAVLAQVPEDDPNVSATPEIFDDDPDAGTIAAVSVPLDPGTRLYNCEVGRCVATESSMVWGSNLYMEGAVNNCALGLRDEFDINRVYQNAAGTWIHHIYHPASGYCLSLQGTETGRANDGYNVQLETCTRSGDALWWFSSDGKGRILIRPYLKNRNGHYPCMEINSSSVSYYEAQVWECGNSRWREWTFPN